MHGVINGFSLHIGPPSYVAEQAFLGMYCKKTMKKVVLASQSNYNKRNCTQVDISY